MNKIQYNGGNKLFGYSNEFTGYMTNIFLSTLFTLGTIIGVYQSCNKEKKLPPNFDISIMYGINDKYTIHVFKEFNDTVISIENNYVHGAGFKPVLIARGLSTPNHVLEIRGWNIQDDALLQSYINKDKLIALRDSILTISNERGLENKLN